MGLNVRKKINYYNYIIKFKDILFKLMLVPH